jgi:hypothetical protein
LIKFSMPKKKPPLSETNPYLKDPKDRRQWIVTTVVSSTAIEGVHFSKEMIESLLDDAPPARKPRKKTPAETRFPEK